MLLSISDGCSDTATGTTGTGGSTSSTATTATTGSGGSVDECSSPTDCPELDNGCLVRLCLDHKCGVLAAAYGTPSADQSDGDCKANICDGNGEKISVNDKGDIQSDGKECTVDLCKDGTLSHAPAPTGTSCVEDGGKRCNDVGACVGCLGNADCSAGSICAAGACVAPSCADGVKNGTETDVDCGGPPCAKCDAGKVCDTSVECKSGLCAAKICATTDPILTAFSAAGQDRFFNLAFDKQGSIIVVGVTSPAIDAASDFSTLVAKFTPQGVLDTTFGVNGFFTKNIAVGTNGESSRAIGFQSTGKILIGATVEHLGAADPRDRDVAVLRLNVDGTLDNTFGTNGVSIIDLSPGVVVGAGFSADAMWHLVVQPDDKIVFSGNQVRPGGTDTDYVMVRLSASGAVDAGFGVGGKVLVDIDNTGANARGLSLLADGSIIESGYVDIAGVVNPVLFKVNSNGALDAAFGTAGVYSSTVLPAVTEAYAVAFQGAKFITTGYGRANAMTESVDWLSLRFLPNGTLDPTYGNSGVPGVSRVDFFGFADRSRHLAVLPDNRVVLCGGAGPTANSVDGALTVLTPNGQLDINFSPTGTKTFDLGGANDMLWSVEVSPDGKYLALPGVKGVAAPGNDDAALVLVPVN